MTTTFPSFPSRIITGDLTIARWTADDAAAMERLITENLDHLRPWMAWATNEPVSLQRRLGLFDRWDRYRASGRGAIYSLRLGDELVGGCALHRRPTPGAAEIGYWLGREASGRGIATGAARALTNAAFDQADIEQVRISHSSDNERSAAVAARLGFTLDAPTQANATSWTLDRDVSLPRTKSR